MTTIVLNIKHDRPAIDSATARSMSAISIMRPNILGNPYRIGPGMSREQAVNAYETYARRRILIDPQFRDAIKRAHGKILLCCCKPLSCHGDIIAKIASELNQEDSGD